MKPLFADVIVPPSEWNLLNTPDMDGLLMLASGIAFSIALGLLLLFIVWHFLPLRKNIVAKTVLIMGLGFTAITVVFVGDPFNILLCVPIFFIPVLFCTEGPKLARFSVGFILFPLILAVNALIDNFVPFSIHYFPRFLFWGLVLLVVHRFAPKEKPRLSRNLWLLLDVLALAPGMAMVSVTVFFDFTRRLAYNESQLPYISWTLGLLPFVAFSCLGLLAAIIVLARHEKLEKEQALWQMRSQYYEALEENQKQVRRLRHDMANHLQTLAGLEGEGAKGYIAELAGTPALTGGRRFCENEVVNTVLSAKSALWEEAGIPAEVRVSLPAEVPVADVDLAALFANCLDNALEANEKLAPENRGLRLSSRAEKGVFLLREENPMEGGLQTEGGRVRTTKRDRENHGFGLCGIEEIATRYGGAADVRAEDGRFVLLVSIPLAAK